MGRERKQSQPRGRKAAFVQPLFAKDSPSPFWTKVYFIGLWRAEVHSPTAAAGSGTLGQRQGAGGASSDK